MNFRLYVYYSLRILLQLRKAAGPKTKLLLADYILPLACVDQDHDDTEEGPEHGMKEVLPGTVKSLAPEGSSLLPNLGKANANAYWLDLTVSYITLPNFPMPQCRLLTVLYVPLDASHVQLTRTDVTRVDRADPDCRMEGRSGD